MPCAYQRYAAVRLAPPRAARNALPASMPHFTNWQGEPPIWTVHPRLAGYRWAESVRRQAENNDGTASIWIIKTTWLARGPAYWCRRALATLSALASFAVVFLMVGQEPLLFLRWLPEGPLQVLGYSIYGAGNLLSFALGFIYFCRQGLREYPPEQADRLIRRHPNTAPGLLPILFLMFAWPGGALAGILSTLMRYLPGERQAVAWHWVWELEGAEDYDGGQGRGRRWRWGRWERGLGRGRPADEVPKR